MGSSPTIQIDVNEALQHIQAVIDLAKPVGFEVQVARYEVADYFVGNRVGCEHKSPSDFVGSLQSGRLFQQAYELAENFDIPIILVDGTVEDVIAASGVERSSILGVTNSLYCHYRTPVYFCGKGNLATVVVGLARKATDDKLPVYNPIRKSATPKQHQLHLISSLPGIGQERAGRILQTYGTPMRALAQWERWADDVDGIGKATVEKVGAILEGRVMNNGV